MRKTGHTPPPSLATRRMALRLALSTAGTGALTSGTASQPIQGRPLRMIVPYAPGGASDLTIRTLAPAATERLGQGFIVENRSGAAGAIGMQAVARAAPDGQTFAIAAESAVLRSLVRPDLGYDARRDLDPVAMLVVQPIVVVAHPSLGIASLPDLLALARRRGAPLPFVTGGQGGTQGFAAASLAERTGIRLEEIAYRGGGQAINDLVGGQVPLGVLGTPPVAAHAREGRLRILAVASAARVATLPGVPTVAEALALDGYAFEQWQGVLAPRHTPAEAITRMSDALIAALQREEVRRALTQLGLEPVGEPPGTFARRIEAEARIWSELGAKFGGLDG